MKKTFDKGFTLAELLIAIGIIGVLVAVSIPMFINHLERSRQAVDLASMRNAKAAAVVEYMITGVTGKYYYYPNGTVSTTTPPSSGYGKSHIDASEFASVLNARGKPYENGKEKYVTVIIDSSKDVSLVWGTVYGAVWNSINGKVVDTSTGGNWYGLENKDKENKEATHTKIASIPNDKRKEADMDILTSIATYFNNCSDETLHNILGNQYKSIVNGNGGVLFSYQIDSGGSYSIRLNPDPATKSVEYLSILGYKPRVYNQTDGEAGLFSFIPNIHNYTDTYLFTSDDFVNMMGTDHKVWIDINSKRTKIWVVNAAGLSVEVPR